MAAGPLSTFPSFPPVISLIGAAVAPTTLAPWAPVAVEYLIVAAVTP